MRVVQQFTPAASEPSPKIDHTGLTGYMMAEPSMSIYVDNRGWIMDARANPVSVLLAGEVQAAILEWEKVY